MTPSNQTVKIFLVAMIVLYCCVLVAGVFTDELPRLVYGVNVVSGGAIMIYWVLKQLRIKQHFYEIREMFVLLFETLLAGSAMYLLIAGSQAPALRLFQYIGFGLHLAAWVLLLIFILIFKIKRLV